MTTLESNSVHKLKRPLLWFALVISVAGFASWSEQRLNDNRAQEIRASRGPNSDKRLAGTQPPSSAALLMQLRIASAMIEPPRTQQRRGLSTLGDDDLIDLERDDSRDNGSFRSSNSRNNGFGQINSQSMNPFSSQSSSPYNASANSGFGQSSSYGRSSSYGQSSSFGFAEGQSSGQTYGQFPSSRTNSRNQNDSSSGLLGSDNPN